VLVIHLDDSGETRDPIVTLAGYLATANDWLSFEVEARKYFDSNGIQVLHTMDLHRLKGEFDGWSRDETKAFASGLFALVARYCPVGLEFSVHKARFNERKQTLGMRREKGPFAFCFKGMVSRLVQNEAIKAVLPWDGVDLSFVIEAGNKNNNSVLDAFNYIKKHNGKFRSMVFEDKEKLIALQVADFLAYFTRRLRTRDANHKRFALEWEFFHRIAQQVPHHDFFLATDFGTMETLPVHR